MMNVDFYVRMVLRKIRVVAMCSQDFSMDDIGEHTGIPICKVENARLHFQDESQLTRTPSKYFNQL